MPDSFKSFLICSSYTKEQLKIDATISDAVDKDNICQNAITRHAHSYKMEKGADGQLHLVNGDALERIIGLCADAQDFRAEGKPDLVRYCLGKVTHYRVDSLTYPHLHRGTPWSIYHKDFEDEMGVFIVKNSDKITHMEFKAYVDVHDDCRETSMYIWPKGLEIVKSYENGTPLTDEQKMYVLRICVQGIGDLWTTLAKELKL